MGPPGCPRWDGLGHVVVGHRRVLWPPFGVVRGGPGEFHPSREENQFAHEYPGPDQGNAVDEVEWSWIPEGRMPSPVGEKAGHESNFKQENVPLKTHEHSTGVEQ